MHWITSWNDHHTCVYTTYHYPGIFFSCPYGAVPINSGISISCHRRSSDNIPLSIWIDVNIPPSFETVYCTSVVRWNWTEVKHPIVNALRSSKIISYNTDFSNIIKTHKIEKHDLILTQKVCSNHLFHSWNCSVAGLFNMTSFMQIRVKCTHGFTAAKY